MTSGLVRGDCKISCTWNFHIKCEFSVSYISEFKIWNVTVWGSISVFRTCGFPVMLDSAKWKPPWSGDMIPTIPVSRLYSEENYNHSYIYDVYIFNCFGTCLALDLNWCLCKFLCLIVCRCDSVASWRWRCNSWMSSSVLSRYDDRSCV